MKMRLYPNTLLVIFLGGLAIFFYCITRLIIFPKPMAIYSNAEIIFQSWPLNIKPDENWSIYFSNSNGSIVGKQEINNWGIFFIWSPDKRAILSLNPNNYPVNDIAGSLIRNGSQTICSGFAFTNRQQWIDENSILTVRNDSINGKYFHPMICLWDLYNCSISKILYEEQTFDIFSNPDISQSGNIVFIRHSADNYNEQSILLFDKTTSIASVISRGSGASWSPNGRYFAFVGDEGIYIYDNKSKSKSLIIDLTKYYSMNDGIIQWDDFPPMPKWSPDNNSLIYHRKEEDNYVIAEWDIINKKEKIIFYGGLYPDWK